MIEYRIEHFAADMATLPRRAPAQPVDPVASLARAMVEIEASGATVDADALQAATRLPRAVIDANAEAARERAYAALTRAANRVRVPAGRAA